MKTIQHGLLGLMLATVSLPGFADTSVFSDKGSFLSATGATAASGAYPDVGRVLSGSLSAGSITITLGAPATQLFIGTGGVSGAVNEDWTSRLPGADIAISGPENLNIALAAPVFSFGYDIVEPEFDPNINAPFVDSSFTVTLSLGGTTVASFSFNPANDTAAFIGVLEAEDVLANYRIGITTTDFYCGPDGCSCSEFVFNCESQASAGAISDHYITPDVENTGTNGGQGRLFESGGMTYFATTTDSDPAPLKAWFTAAATAAGEDGCSFEMSSAGAAYAAHPANAAANSGFFRDAGAVLMVFVLTDEPEGDCVVITKACQTLILPDVSFSRASAARRSSRQERSVSVSHFAWRGRSVM